ncbi:pyridoxamine 5'-phosphate oxidase family protein [Pedococcus aerophilus]|uniref:Pyridoxamine 5'-phosphate oxidase family protein n=1 Tax=Pedococcus aerophilus TaxID=436356 RepID=A0ABN3UEY3_9MICO
MTTSTEQGTHEIPLHECWALLRDAVVGRLATAIDGHPEIFPVNHVVDHATIVIRTAAGTKLESAAGQPVAFEVDGYDVGSASAWSVVVKGRATEVSQLHDVLDAMSLPLFPWHDSVKPHFLRVGADEVTGRRFSVSGGAHRPPIDHAPTS